MIAIKDYVEGLFKDVPDSVEKENIKNEIIYNLEEKVQDLIEKGKAEEDAINKSIVEFGDVSEIRTQLMGAAASSSHEKKTNTKNYATAMWFSIWAALLIIGFVFFINYTTSWGYPWFVYPTFGVLWWPLVASFKWISHKKK